MLSKTRYFKGILLNKIKLILDFGYILIMNINLLEI